MLNQLPSDVADLALKHFQESTLKKALLLLSQSKLRPSFSKGGHKNNFIISGLIIDDQTFNSRVTYRDDEVSSKCNCSNWSEGRPCEHVGAFFLHYLVSESDLNSETTTEDAVAPQFIGKMVRRPSSLQGNKAKHYTELNYQLCNREIISFPSPGEISNDVKLVFNINPKDNTIFTSNTDQWPVSFYLMKDKLIENVTLFDTQFIFDWENGKSYNIPENLKFVLKNLQTAHFASEPYILLKQLEDCPYAICAFNKTIIKEDNADELKVSLVIEESSKKYHYSLKCFFIDSEKKEIQVPNFAIGLVTLGGGLQDFSSRIELGNFLDHYFESDESYKKYCYTTSNKEHFINTVDPVIEKNNLIFVDKKTEKLYRLNNNYFKTLKSIYYTLGKNIFKSADYNEFENTYIEYSIPSRIFEENLPTFFREQDENDIKIFFNKKRIKRWKSASSIQRNFSSKDWFDISIELTKEEIALINEFNKSQSTYIDEDKLILLTDEDKAYLNLVKKYLTEGSAEKVKLESGKFRYDLTLNRCRLFDIYNLYQSSGFDLLTEEEKKTCEKLLNIDKIPPYAFPTNVKGVPRDYQIKGYQWLRLLHELKLGACLADDMGLGKTFQTITFLESLKDQIGKVLIICPVSILMNWRSEFEKFSTLRPVLYYGEERTITEENKVVITSYGLLRKESDTILNQFSWDILVMDEVQKLKNAKSVGAQSARKIKSNFRICLTGTPVENDLSEFYNIIDLAVPGIWGNQKNLSYFRKNKNARFIARDIAKPFILRRTKSQVLKDLPEKLEQTVYLTFSKDEKSNYVNNITQIRKRFEDNTQSKKYAQILKDLLRLRQLCLWQDFNNNMHSTKIDFLINTLEQIIQEDHQILVYSQFTKYLDIIQSRIEKNKWKFSRIDGSYSIKKRQKQVDEFQSGNHKIFLISLKAGGLGLNLTKANYIFIMDPWWNPAVENQAIDRAYRIGQERNITVYRPIMKDSVEEKVLQLQERKKELFRDLLDQKSQEDFSGKLTLEDFKMILS